MAHKNKVVIVTTYTTTDGTIFTVQETADTYEASYLKNIKESKTISENKSKLIKLADGYSKSNPYFHYISRGGEYTSKRLGLNFSNTTALDVVKNLLILSPDVMSKIISEISPEEKK